MSPVPSQPAAAARDIFRTAGARTRYVAAAVLLAAAVEVATPLPGLRLAVAAGVVAGPALAFTAFWRALVWLRRGNLDGLLAARHRPDWRGRRLLWAAFGALWTVDAIAAASFFRVEAANEVNPITVALHGVAGLPGVLVAALCYAVLVVALVRALSDPTDFDVLVFVTLLYAAFALHNAVLLFGGP